MHLGTLLYLSFLSLSFTKASQLKVSVYYETLCPDSIRFITSQLYPSYKYFEKYLDLDLVPFGKAEASNSSGHWEFICQHGPLECYNNKVQSCVIAYTSESSTLKFVNCALNTDERSNDSLISCAHASNVSWDAVSDCLRNGKGDEILAENGMKTKSVSPPISYIPTIIFNGVYSKPMQDEAQKHFFRLVCFLLKNKPDACKKLELIYNLIV